MLSIHPRHLLKVPKLDLPTQSSPTPSDKAMRHKSVTDCPACPPVQSVTEADEQEMNGDGNPSYSMCKEHPYSCSTSSHATSTSVAAVANGAAPGSGRRIISLSIATFQSTTSERGFVHSGIGTT